ncbi:MAG: outer membrane protein assembly factor BamA, partial [Pseudomonadales bacterium]|nr:outer membrane protein assembly factor BamA [Pseudomonadales bacterium]
MSRLILVFSLLFSVQLVAQEKTSTFRQVQLADIRVEGLQRVSPETVFAAMPLNIGDTVDISDLQSASRSIFRTGFFDDIQLGLDENVLIITVAERPAIAEIILEGNKAIETEKLMDALQKSGLAEGMIFKQATLEGIAQELLRQYVAQGRYGADVKTHVEALPGNRVALSIDIKEGKVAAIKHINIVGNTSFSTDDLLALFEQETSGWFSWMNNKDKYSREKLTGDLERLKSFYLDRGYLRFSIDSTQVSLSKNKKSIFITINITEGGVYTVNDIALAGDLILPESDIRELVVLDEGRTFSQIRMTTTSEYITQRLGNDGYAFAEVRGLTDIDDENRTVDVTFFVNPGERTYVRRINFRGNTKTADEVLRRELRQMESGLASSSKIEQSKIRLQRLGYFRNIDVETVEVPGSGDQIDLEYKVEEQPSGSLGASLGFAQGSGVVLGANIQQDNFLGSGKHIGLNVSTSSYTDQVTFSYVDPYFTPDGVSR